MLGSVIIELETQIDAKGHLVLQEDLLHLQQNGAPPHYFHSIRQWLNEKLPD